MKQLYDQKKIIDETIEMIVNWAGSDWRQKWFILDLGKVKIGLLPLHFKHKKIKNVINQIPKPNLYSNECG